VIDEDREANVNRLGRSTRLKLCVLAFVPIMLVGCVDRRIQDDYVPAGSLRLAQIGKYFTRADVLGEPEARNLLLACGVKEQEISDHSLALVRVYCCGGAIENTSARVIYVPPTIYAGIGDIVEVRVGSPPHGDDPGTLHTATRVCQKAGVSGPIRWDPPNERLWMRVLYADWMPAQGWVRHGGIHRMWYKPPPK
jgi:hypothetical protein